jgi:hypothetical protein
MEEYLENRSISFFKSNHLPFDKRIPLSECLLHLDHSSQTTPFDCLVPLKCLAFSPKAFFLKPASPTAKTSSMRRISGSKMPLRQSQSNRHSEL